MTIHPPASASAVALLAAALALPVQAQEPSTATAQASPVASPDTDMQQQIEAMQAQIAALQAQLDQLQQAAAQPAPTQPAVSLADATASSPDNGAGESLAVAAVDETQVVDEDGIQLGGALRFQYSHEGYNADNRRRNGDTDFDIFRLDLHGKVKGVALDMQWRWFQYMSAMHHGWVGYDFTEQSQLQVGLTRIPFGNQPYNSHSYFFSSNYYLGLEDTYAMGAQYIYDDAPWNLQLAFFKNDGVGGIDGYVSDRTASYSYNVLGVRAPGEGIYDDPAHPAATVDSVAARLARNFSLGEDFDLELGASILHGGLEDATSSIGDYSAWALHANANIGRWNIQAQASRYRYDVDGGADLLAVGAYGFYDSIAARASSYTFNVAYHLPVSWGPVSGLDFYNDYSLINHKSGDLPRTWMNVTGVALAAGSLYTYFDFVTARNQPFIGGSMAADGKTEHRFNINVGYYF